MNAPRRLGFAIGRRTFLERAATAIVVAPILGLFARKGIEGAGAQSVAEPFGNAQPPLPAYEVDFMPMLNSILDARYDARIASDVASRLVHGLLDVLLAAAGKNASSVSGAVRVFIDQVKGEEATLPDHLTRQLLEGAEKHL